jgi:hypothetical protein
MARQWLIGPKEFVQKRLQDIRWLLFADVPQAKVESSNYCTAITLTQEGSTFRIAGDWNLLILMERPIGIEPTPEPWQGSSS